MTPPAPPAWTLLAAEPSSAAPAVARPAGFWRRAGALLVDLLVVWALLKAGDLVATALGGLELVARAFTYSYAIVVPAAYFTLAHGTGGRTLGKRAAGVRVVTDAGGPLGYPQALARYVAWWLSLLPLGIGFLMAAIRHDRRALHDLVAGTRAVRARPGAGPDDALLS
jgi:uncharacterized RDD family membrane protein YckC